MGNLLHEDFFFKPWVTLGAFKNWMGVEIEGGGGEF